MANFVKRSEVHTYIETGTVSGAPVYALFDAGVMALDDALNPATVTEQYIMDISSTTTVDAYQPSFAFTMRVDKDDEVATFIRTLGKSLAVGTAAETTIVRFDAWEIEVDGTVPAKQFAVAVAVDYTDNGEGGSKVEMAGTLYVQGDPIDGTFDTTDGSFTATV